jgi:hypothetical protein
MERPITLGMRTLFSCGVGCGLITVGFKIEVGSGGAGELGWAANFILVETCKNFYQ